MRTTPALRTLAAALFTGGVLTVVAAGTSAAATAPTHTLTNGGGGSDSPIWGTIVSRGEMNVRQQPTTNSPVVDALSPGSQDRVQCVVRGQSVFGNSDWYWLVGAQGWASAAFVDTGRQWVPSCSDPCPGWKDRSNNDWNDGNWHDNNGNNDNSSWNSGGSGSWSFSASGSWSFSASGSFSGSSSWDSGPGW